jgi:hypothetical protein
MPPSKAAYQATQDRLRATRFAARAFLAPGKAEAMARDWIGQTPGVDADWNQALDWACEAMLMTPSLLGVTAYDRLARAKPADPEALGWLRAATLRLLRVEQRRCIDLASGESVALVLDYVPPTAFLFGRFVKGADGMTFPVGEIANLDESDTAIALSYARSAGRGLGNQAGCAQAVFRHLVRQGRTAPPPFDPEGNALDRYARDWASATGDPSPREYAKVRLLTDEVMVIRALTSTLRARRSGMAALAEAYRRLANVMVETMTAREANGASPGGLGRIGAIIEERIATDGASAELRAMFDALCAAGRARAVGRAGSAELEGLMRRIQALRAKTVQQGCTEHEALAAAKKIAELLDRYGLSLSAIELREHACEGMGVETGRKRRGPIDDCIGVIASFFDCRVWAEYGADETLRYVFFGLPGDVRAAVYLHDLVALAFVTETGTFQSGELYRETARPDRRGATTSFQAGLARGINRKLQTLRRERERASGEPGRALVPVKQARIDDELDRLGLNFQRRSGSKRMVREDAYGAGQAAGARFEYRPGIEMTS